MTKKAGQKKKKKQLRFIFLPTATGPTGGPARNTGEGSGLPPGQIFQEFRFLNQMLSDFQFGQINFELIFQFQ